ncbi:MAG TPA: SWIM zinc finger family protein [Ramlibacter sp.]|nr:SWIM zinc finger family protein [Ramlibacter sp.]
MSFYAWKPYVSVAQRRATAAKALAKAKTAGKAFAPIPSFRGGIAKTFWGKAWCDNLEAYSDFANRLPRGRTYVRNGSVIDLQIGQGKVQAQVMGSSLYQVEVSVEAVPAARWKTLGKACAGSIDSMVELLQGKLSTAVMQTICAPASGLFPAPREIRFSCSCPDWAGMCKHVAAVFYGVGARLDQSPELIFGLRGVDARDLITQASKGVPKPARGKRSAKVLDDAALADVFGLEMDDAVAAGKPLARKAKAAATPPAAAPKKVAPRKVPPVDVPVSDKPPAQKRTSTKGTIRSEPAAVKKLRRAA